MEMPATFTRPTHEEPLLSLPRQTSGTNLDKMECEEHRASSPLNPDALDLFPLPDGIKN